MRHRWTVRRKTLRLAAATLAMFVFALGAANGQEAAPREAVEIGTRLELFVDDYMVESMSGSAVRRLHHPARREVVHVLDKPWEGDTSAYLSLVRDGEKILLYYNATPRRSQQTTAVIESFDGVNFTRPSLGLVEFEGSTDNNLLPVRRDFGAAGHNFAPFLDPNPDAPAEERYKAISYFRRGGGINAYVSSDGLTWRAVGEEPIIGRYAEDGSRQGAFDSQNVGFWDPVRKVYVCYYRGPDPRGPSRGIWRSTSEDFVHWTKPQPIDYTDEHLWHMYTNGIRPYFRAPHIYIGIPNRLVTNRKKVADHPNPGVNDALLMSSRDGKLFDRWEEAFIRPGPEPRMWTDRNTYPTWGMVQTSPEEISIYWTEHYRYPGMRFRRGTIRTDGFVSVYANSQGGEMVTRPLVFSGDRLMVNYATSATGEMRFELQDETGEPLTGFALGDSEGLFGNSIGHIVSWGRRSDLSELKGRPVRLRVSLKDAHLYSIRFDAAENITARLERAGTEASRTLATRDAAFDSARRKKAESASRRLAELLSEEGAPTQRAVEEAERLTRAIAEFKMVERAAERAQEALDAAAAALEEEAAFGKAYQVAVALLQERLAARLADEEATAEQVASLADRLAAAVGDYGDAKAARAEGEKAIATSEDIIKEPSEGFGLLYQGAIERQRDALRSVLGDPQATLATVRSATERLSEAIEAYREAGEFPDVRPVRVAGFPASVSTSERADWENGAMVNTKTDGDDLVLAEEVAIRFNGEGTYVQCGADDRLKPEALTIEAWVKIEDEYLSWFPIVFLGKDIEAVLQERRPAWAEHAYNLWAHGNRPQFTLGSEGGDLLARTRRGPTVELNRWQHVAAQFDGKEARIYLNGRLADTTEYSGSIDYHWSNAIRIGGKIGDYNWFVGQIRDVRIWNTVRTEQEIQDSMRGPLPAGQPGLVGRWIAGRRPGDGDNVFDTATGAHHGKLVGAEWVLPQGYWLSSPLSFPQASSVERSTIEWRTSTEGDATKATAEILIGLSDSDESLPDEWRRAVSGGPVPFVKAGDDLSGKRVWIKAKLSRSDPGASVRLRKLTLKVE